MAGIIVSEASGLNDALFGKIQVPLKSLMLQYAEAQDVMAMAPLIFSERSSNHSMEGYTSITGIDDWEPVPENGAYPTTSFEQGYEKVITNLTFKQSIRVSQEMMEDGITNHIKQQSNNLVSSLYRTKEKLGARMIGEALQSKSSFTIGAKTFDTTGADGQVVFSKTHKPKVKGSNQSNLYAGAFSETNLGLAATAMQNLKNDNGETMALAPDTIIIPNIADLKKEVFGVLGAHQSTDEAASNKYNYQFGNWRVIVWPRLGDYLGTLLTATGATTPWLLMDSHFMEVADCAILQERVKATIKSEIESNDANLWKGRWRGGYGFVDFRGLFACGVLGGSTL